MASILQEVVTDIQLANYASFVMMVAVGYDYILAFPDEIEYIWNKPWTRFSALYIVARYSALCLVIFYSLVQTSFLPGPAKAYVFMFQLLLIDVVFKRLIIFDRCEILYTSLQWILNIFFSVADLAMILRVWILYKKSILILCGLLVFLVIEIVLRLVSSAMQSTNSLAPVVAKLEVLDFSICTLQSNYPLFAIRIGIALDIVQVIFGGLMCLLVCAQFTRESLQMYRATKRIELSRYMSLFMREGIFYFVAILSAALFNLLTYVPNVSLNVLWWWNVVNPILQVVPTFVLVPRLILTLPKLYARIPSQRGGHTGTPDPFSSMDSDRVQADTTLFAHPRKCEGTEQGDEIEMVDREAPFAGPSRA